MPRVWKAESISNVRCPNCKAYLREWVRYRPPLPDIPILKCVKCKYVQVDARPANERGEGPYAKPERG